MMILFLCGTWNSFQIAFVDSLSTTKRSAIDLLGRARAVDLSHKVDVSLGRNLAQDTDTLSNRTVVDVQGSVDILWDHLLLLNGDRPPFGFFVRIDVQIKNVFMISL